MKKAKKTAKQTKAGKRLIQAAKEMVAHYKGEIDLPSRRVAIPKSIDVASIRKEFGYSQQKFADNFGFALSAVKDWEQGRRTPELSARILLTVIATNPKAVEQALTRM